MALTQTKRTTARVNKMETQQQTQNRQEQKKLAKIEFEDVTLRLPKKLMDFLRKTPERHDPNAISYLEYLVVDNIRAELEAITGTEIIEWYGLKPVFYAILKDERFHP
jgi:hypothetical protein